MIKYLNPHIAEPLDGEPGICVCGCNVKTPGIHITEIVNDTENSKSFVEKGMPFVKREAMEACIESDTWQEGTKLDDGKARYDLIPSIPLEDIAKVFTFGAEKYSPRNWEKGIDFGRLYSAAQRHMIAFWQGEEADPESGLPHLAHAGCCLMMLAGLSGNAKHDDRPTKVVSRD